MNSHVIFYNSQTIDNLIWPSNYHLTKDYLISFVKNPIHYLIKNASADFQLLKIDDIIIPVTICDFIENNTYLVSPYTQYINYTLDELSIISHPFFRKIAYFSLKMLGAFLKKGNVDKCVHVNNWLFPTNIYKPLTEEQVKKITASLKNKFPEHAILFRTLNFITDPSLIKTLSKSKYFLIGSRQVHMLTHQKITLLKQKKPTDLKRDEKILKSSKYCINEQPFDEKDKTRMKQLYDYLYLEKHSYFNPQFTQYFFNLLINSPMFNVKALKNEDQLDAFIGCFTDVNISYSPLFGYDTQQTEKIGLYRMLSAIKINFAMDHNTTLHSSAGAGRFKRHRGHESTSEYHAVYTKHLSIARRGTWMLLTWIVNNIGMPLIQRYDA